MKNVYYLLSGMCCLFLIVFEAMCESVNKTLQDAEDVFMDTLVDHYKSLKVIGSMMNFIHNQELLEMILIIGIFAFFILARIESLHDKIRS